MLLFFAKTDHLSPHNLLAATCIKCPLPAGTEKLILPQLYLGGWPTAFPPSFFGIFLPTALINDLDFSSVFWEAAKGG